MSIALESNSNNPIDRSGFVHRRSCSSIYDSTDSGRQVTPQFAGDNRFSSGNTSAATETMKEEEQDRGEDLDSCSSSSIGRNSDTSEGSSAGEDGSGEAEVQSSYKGPLDTLDGLEEVLPIKRGISNFYCGKSKSFTSLADASSCSSIRDIAKREDPYTRKRKNLVAHSAFFDKNHNSCLRGNIGGISKRAANSKSTLDLTMTMSGLQCDNEGEASNSSSSPPTLCLPPLPPRSRRAPNCESVVPPPSQKFSSWRSFSLSDLQAAAAAASTITG